MAGGYTELELDITAGDTQRYRVEARSSDGGESAIPLLFGMDGLALEQRLQRLRLALLSSAATVRRIPFVDEQPVQELGAELFDRLFAGDVRVLYDTARQEAAKEGRRLRLVLRIRPPELAALPWEFLYDVRRDDYLSLSVPIVRYPEVLEPIRPLGITPPLRILGMVTRPEGYDRLAVDLEKDQLQRALSPLSDNRRLELTWVQGETWRDLRRAMNQGEWHVLHYVGHGGFDTTTGEGMLVLAGESGGNYHLRASRLAQLLSPHHSLRLVILNACESAAASEHDLFSSAATSLIRRGIPAVLAMQFQISDAAAIEFTRSFYESIADGLPVDVAVTDARVAMSLARPNSFEWGIPVLFLRPSDGRIFNLSGAEAAGAGQARPPRAGGTSRQVRPMVAGGATAPVAPRVAPQAPGPAQPPSHAEPRARQPEPRGRSKWGRTLAVVAAVVAACVLAAGVRLVATLSHRPGTSIVTSVPANQAWTDTGIRVARGQTISLHGEGTISATPGIVNGPDGVPGRTQDAMAVVPQANYAALIGKVGNGAPFLVGRQATYRADATGQLQLGVNDQYFPDNTERFTARVAVTR
jgi:CHAT domain